MAIRAIKQFSRIESDGGLPAGANPGYERSCCVNPCKKNALGVGLNPKERTAFFGICGVSTGQLLQCYGDIDGYITPELLANYCRECPYCLAPKHKPGSDTIVFPHYILDMPEVDENSDFPGSFVYFVTDGQFVKIGVAKNPSNRLVGIQTGNPRECSILSLIPCKGDAAAHSLEKKLHYIYRRQSVRGEWFDLLSFIDIESFKSILNPKLYL